MPVIVFANPKGGLEKPLQRSYLPPSSQVVEPLLLS